MRAPPCPHRPPCPGCPRYGEPGIPARALERLAAFAARDGLAAPAVIAGPPLASRHRARLLVRGRTRTPKIGIFQEGSHRLVDIPRCHTHHPLINRVAGAVRETAREIGVESYAERPHRGALRAIQVVIERRSQRAQLVLVENASTPGPVAELLPGLEARLADALHSVWWNGHPERGNAVLGSHWQRLAGPEVIWDEVADCEIAFPPGAFGQSQPELAERIARRAQSCVPEGARALELFAGCGPLGMGLLRRAERVAFNEQNPHGLDGLARSLALRPAEERARAALCPGPAEARGSEIAAADAVLLDPPRRGVAPELIEALGATPPRDLVWISCGLDAFLDQAERLRERAGLVLRALEAYALFPFTEHVETLAHFQRP